MSTLPNRDHRILSQVVVVVIVAGALFGLWPTCAIAIVDASGILVLAVLLITVSGFAAVAIHAAWPVLAGLVSAIAFYFWRQHRAQLLIVTSEETEMAKKSAFALWLLSVFPGLFN